MRFLRNVWVGLGISLVFLAAQTVQDRDKYPVWRLVAIAVPILLAITLFTLLGDRAQRAGTAAPEGGRHTSQGEAAPPIPIRWFLSPWYLLLTVAAPAALFGTIGYIQGFWPGGLFAGLLSGACGAAGSLAVGLIRRRDERLLAAQAGPTTATAEADDRGTTPST